MTANVRLPQWRYAALAGVLVLALFPALPRAADDDVSDRVDRMERALRDLEYQVYKGDPPDDATRGAGPVAMAPGGGARLNDMENSLRELRGQVESLTFQVKSLTEQLDIARKESNYRLGALEGGAPAALPPARSGAPVNAVSAPPPALTSANPPSASGPISLTPGAGSNQMGQKPGTLGTIPADSVPPATAGGLSPRQQYDAAMELLSKQDPSAQSAFRAFVTTNPTDELAGPALFWVGDISFGAKDYQGAARAFADLLKRYSKTARAPDAMLKLGLSLMELGKKKEGCTTLVALKGKYPNANKTTLDRAAKRAADEKCT